MGAPMAGDPAAYTVAHEINFITGLGQRSMLRTTRGELLVSYRDALRRRCRWGGLSPRAVLTYIDAAIQREATGA
jgi:hypothetical protein